MAINMADAQKRLTTKAFENLTNVSKELGSSRLRVCVVGSCEFQSPDTQALVTSITRRLAQIAQDSMVIVTSSQAGVQEAFARGLAEHKPDVVNLVPKSGASSYAYGRGIGRDVTVGANARECSEIFTECGHVYLVIEGGANAAKEAKAALQRGAMVIPLIWTGGAAGGEHSFPQEAMKRPEAASEEQWMCLSQKTNLALTATALVMILYKLIWAKVI